MIWINFGKWDHKGGRLFTFERIYIKGYRWTPIVRFQRRRKRVVKHYPDGKTIEEVEKDHYCNGTDHLGDLGCGG